MENTFFGMLILEPCLFLGVTVLGNASFRASAYYREYTVSFPDFKEILLVTAKYLHELWSKNRHLIIAKRNLPTLILFCSANSYAVLFFISK